MTTETLSELKPNSASKSQLATISELLPIFRQLGAWSYAAGGVALYISGFLVLNASLAKHGLYEFEFVNARYLVAGGTYAFFLVCFYLSAGRAVLFTPKWLQEDLTRVNQSTARPLWSVVTFLHSLITAAFFCCLSAALFTTIAISSSYTVLFYSVLGGVFLLLYTVDVTNLDLKFPRAAELLQIVVKISAIYVFFEQAPTSPLLLVFFFYGTIFFFINLVLDRLKRYKTTTDRLTFTGIYFALFLLISALTFGSVVYTQISSRLGGAKPLPVSIGLAEEAKKALPQSVAASAVPILVGQLVYQTPSFVYVEIDKKTFRFRANDVVTLSISPEADPVPWKSLIDNLARVKNAP